MKKGYNNKILRVTKLILIGTFLVLGLLFAGQQISNSGKSSLINCSALIKPASAATVPATETTSEPESNLETGVAIPGHGTTFSDFTGYIKAVFDFSLKLGVALTALMLIFAGYKYMTSQGNPTALNEAKDIMIGSISGFIMLLLVYLILNVYNLPTP